MEKYVITIDTGTSNTRVFLWNGDGTLAAGAGAGVGVHDTAIEGSNARLKQAVRGCIEEVLQRAGIGYEAVARVMASGMITSNVGLAEVPHVNAPAGKKELAQGAVSRLLEDVCPLPILFIPGVRNAMDRVDAENFEAMDIMRGEEVETIAVLEAFPAGRPYLLVLPGSHTKFVRVDEKGRIAGCLTTIAGELLDCITRDTVIADSVGRRFVSEAEYDRAMVLRGFEVSARTGLGRAAFTARIQNMFVEKDKTKLANFLLGAVLAGDVQAVRNSRALAVNPGVTVIVSGKAPLRQAVADVLRHDGFFACVEEYVPDPALPLSAAGTRLIAQLL